MAKAKKANKKTCALICPRCTLYWADMRYDYGSYVSAGDVIVYVGQKLKDGDELICPGCKHRHTNHDTWLAIASPKTKLKPGDRAVKEVASTPAENGDQRDNGTSEIHRL